MNGDYTDLLVIARSAGEAEMLAERGTGDPSFPPFDDLELRGIIPIEPGIVALFDFDHEAHPSAMDGLETPTSQRIAR